MHTNSTMIFDKYALPLLASKPGAPPLKILELGVGKRYWLSPYRAQAAKQNWGYHFCDYGNFGRDQKEFVEQVSEYLIAAKDGQFGAIISLQTFEHVRKPWLLIREASRILKKGGIIALVVPLTWKYHKNPVDCWRIYPEAMKAILEEGGFEPLVCRAEHLGQTPEEVVHQIGKVDVQDCIGIGRKK